MALSTFDRYYQSCIAVGAELYVTPQTDKRRPDAPADDTDADLTLIADEEWHNLADVFEEQQEQEVSNDEKTYWSHIAHKWSTDKDPRVVGNTKTFECKDYTPLFHALTHGIKNPDTADYGAGQKIRTYATSQAGADYCVKLVHLNANGDILETEYLYARLTATNGTTYNEKTVRPKIEMQIQDSEHNCTIMSQILTGQTGTPDA